MTEALLPGSIRNFCPQIKPGVGTQPAWLDRFPDSSYEARWFNADCVSAHAGVPPLRHPSFRAHEDHPIYPLVNLTAISCRRPGLRSAVAELAQENPPIKIVPRDADKDSHMALSEHLANRQGPERQFRPPVRHGSEEDHCCGQGTSVVFPRMRSSFLRTCSHDPGGTVVLSTQSWRDQHIRKVIRLPRAIR